jgi:hypothetical protein
MYTTIYTFGFHIRSVLFLLVVSTIFVLSGIFAFLANRNKQKAHQERFSWLFMCAISGCIAITFWWSYYADYSYYAAIYRQHTYQIVQGTIHPLSQDPHNREVFQVGDIVFRNSPRQLTAAFSEHRQIFHYVKEGAEVRIYYTQDYWRPAEFAIVQIDAANPLP